MTQDSPRTIVFDLGRVLVDIVDGPFITAMAAIVGTDRDELAQRLRDIEEPFETGKIDSRHALAHILEAPGGSWTEDRGSPGRLRAERLLAAALASRFAPIPESIEIVHALSNAGHRLALASNTNPLDMDAIRSNYPDVLTPFGERLYLSYELGMMKPSPEFFHALTTGLRVEPEECLFVDDRPGNVKTAREMGMEAILYEEPERLKATLRTIVGVYPDRAHTPTEAFGGIRTNTEAAWSMWRDYCEANPEANDVPESNIIVDHFGDSAGLATELIELVLKGEKRATAASLWTAQTGGEPIPYPGLYSIMVDGSGAPRCILLTTSVEIVRFDEVREEFAHAEGEDDRTLASWRREHERYFRRELPHYGRSFCPRMPLLCERFTVVWPSRYADG